MGAMGVGAPRDFWTSRLTMNSASAAGASFGSQSSEAEKEGRRQTWFGVQLRGSSLYIYIHI